MDDFLWWRDGVIYQIYPRSFADSDGDGLGDLRGIISKLDYLAFLRVDGIWLSPIYPSPDKDFGYDVADHTAIDPRYGTLEDFEALVREAHKRGIRVILDMVLNHTSDQHPWFRESRSSRENPKRDWYLWRDVPNNWASVFGGSGWEYDEKTGQYYFHMFLKEQPDVNWQNPAVRQAQLDVFRFWLERGVDGFRLDVFNAYFKHPGFVDNPTKFGLRRFDKQVHVNDMDRPEMIPLLGELRSLLDSYPERYSVGEPFIPTIEKTARYAGEGKLHTAFHFFYDDMSLVTKWGADHFRRQMLDLGKASSGLYPPALAMSNHDSTRAASRYCRGEDDANARIAMALLLTMRGTPFIYYGEEIGMRNISLSRKEIMDPVGRYYWPIIKGRDGCRAPMQWNDSANAGFSTAKPWFKLHPDYTERNVLAQENDAGSMLNFTRRLISLRKEYSALRDGGILFLEPPQKDLLAYLRLSTEGTILVGLNFSGRSKTLDLPPGDWQPLLSTSARDVKIGENVELAPHEVCLMKSV
jgi:alpha-glucosidase